MTRTFGTSSTRSGSSGERSATAREMRFAPAGASLRTNARRPAVPSRSAARRPSFAIVGLDRPELRAIPECLLEVVADDLLELERSLAEPALEPLRVALVQTGPHLLRHRLVGRIPNQEVAKAERALAREERPIGPDELLAHE